MSIYEETVIEVAQQISTGCARIMFDSEYGFEYQHWECLMEDTGRDALFELPRCCRPRHFCDKMLPEGLTYKQEKQ